MGFVVEMVMVHALPGVEARQKLARSTLVHVDWITLEDRMVQFLADKNCAKWELILTLPNLSSIPSFI